MKKALALALTLALFACGETRVVDLNDPNQTTRMQNVMELEFRDWENVAQTMTTSMIASGAFTRIKDPVIAMGPMINDTAQRFDTDILVRKIRATLVNSGKARIATNFTGEDATSDAVRAQRGNAEFDAGTIAAKGTLVAPNLSLSGKMLQRTFQLQSGWFSSVDTRVEYYLQLALTDLRTGLSVWEGTKPIVKEGNRAPAW